MAPVSKIVETQSIGMCETNSGAAYIYGPWGSSIAAALVEKISGKCSKVESFSGGGNVDGVVQGMSGEAAR